MWCNRGLLIGLETSLTLHHITLHHVTLHRMASHRIASWYITIYYVTLHHITLHNVTSHYIMYVCMYTYKCMHIVVCIHFFSYKVIDKVEYLSLPSSPALWPMRGFICKEDYCSGDDSTCLYLYVWACKLAGTSQQQNYPNRVMCKACSISHTLKLEASACRRKSMTSVSLHCPQNCHAKPTTIWQIFRLAHHKCRNNDNGAVLRRGHFTS